MLVDGDTGLILKQNTLPTGDTPPAQSNFKHLTIAPDGTLILQEPDPRRSAATMQGTMAIVKGVMKGYKQPNSHLVAVDPETLEILDDISLPEPATVPHIITMFEGRIAIYIGMDSGAAALLLGSGGEEAVAGRRPGRHDADAGGPDHRRRAEPSSATGSSCRPTASAARPSRRASSPCTRRTRRRMKVIFPFGELKKGEWSFAPPKAAADPENNMIYSADMGVGKTGGHQARPGHRRHDDRVRDRRHDHRLPAADRPEGQAGAAC